MALLSELRRRKVFKVAAVYAVTAWLLVQIIVSIKAPLDLPAWSDTLVIVLLGIGFPVALILSWAFDLTPEGIRPAQAPARVAERAAAGPHGIYFALQALVLLAVGFLLFEQYLQPESAAGGGPATSPADPLAASGTGRTERFSILTPADASVRIGGSPIRAIAISRAGDTIAYVSEPRPGTATETTPPAIAIRHIGSRGVEIQPGPGGQVQPFFSPDGRWVGFFTREGQMQKRLAEGNSAPVTIASGLNGTPWGFGLWHETGDIFFSLPADDYGLFRVSSEGGTPTRAIEPDPLGSETAIVATDFIPGTDIVLLTTIFQRGDRQIPQLEALDIVSGERTIIAENAALGSYISSGHLLFRRDDVNLVAAFDPASLSLTGPAIPLTDEIRLDTGNLVPQLAVARDGTLAYLPDDRARGGLVLVDREGTVTALPEPEGYYKHVSVSADGSRAAIGIQNAPGGGVRIYDFASGDMRQLTERGSDGSAEWRPDGRALALTTFRSEVQGLVERDLSGRERVVVATTSTGPGARNVSWHPDMNLIAYTRQAGSEHDIWIARITDDEIAAEPLLASPRLEYSPRFSPDGRWLAFTGRDGNAINVYVMAFPDGEPVAVWRDNAEDPRWSKTRPELFFRTTVNDRPTMMSVQVGGSGDRPELDEPVAMFPLVQPNDDGSATVFHASDNTGPAYDVLPDGRFLMIREANVAPPQEIAITRNWLPDIEGL